MQQYDRFMQVYNENANKDAVRMNSLGNHDYWNGLSVEGAQKRFLEKTGMESIYYHKVVKGYHFLCYVSREWNNSWLLFGQAN